LATIQSSDNPKPIIPGAGPIASASGAPHVEFAQQLSVLAGFFANFGKYQKAGPLKILSFSSTYGPNTTSPK
jgi:hypothetical protein